MKYNYNNNIIGAFTGLYLVNTVQRVQYNFYSVHYTVYTDCNRVLEK